MRFRGRGRSFRFARGGRFNRRRKGRSRRRFPGRGRGGRNGSRLLRIGYRM